jgi:hypothetical protein
VCLFQTINWSRFRRDHSLSTSPVREAAIWLECSETADLFWRDHVRLFGTTCFPHPFICFALITCGSQDGVGPWNRKHDFLGIGDYSSCIVFSDAAGREISIVNVVHPVDNTALVCRSVTVLANLLEIIAFPYGVLMSLI